jgi:hypothetical protein
VTVAIPRLVASIAISVTISVTVPVAPVATVTITVTIAVAISVFVRRNAGRRLVRVVRLPTRHARRGVE